MEQNKTKQSKTQQRKIKQSKTQQRKTQQGKTKQSKSQQTITTQLDKMNLLDSFLFDETMENPEAYSAMISILLEKEIEILNRTETEKELRVSPQLRSVRLDVMGEDKEYKLYYTEMQKENTYNLSKRSRFYQAQIDVSLLEPGETDFNKLQDTCFILIAPFDIFGKGLYRYTFEGVCRECPELKLPDGILKVFINTKGTNSEDFSQEFLDLMDYICQTTEEKAKATKSEKIKTIHRTVEKIKKSEKAGLKYMQAWEEKALIRKAARAEGEEKILIKQILKKLQKGRKEQDIIEELAEEIEEKPEVLEGICRAIAMCQKEKPECNCDDIYDFIHSSHERDGI